MASSSRILTKSPTFETWIHPELEYIILPEKFVGNWKGDLIKHNYAYIVQEQRSIRVTLLLAKNNNFIVDGKAVSRMFNIAKQTKVELHYMRENNHFRMTKFEDQRSSFRQYMIEFKKRPTPEGPFINYNMRMSTFETWIDPRMYHIMLPRNFTEQWRDRIQNDGVGYIWKGQERATVVFRITKFWDFLSDGKEVAKFFGFDRLTKVEFKYHIKKEGFTFKILPDHIHESLPQNQRDLPQYQNMETDAPEATNMNVGDGLPIHTWEVRVTEAMLNMKRKQVLHLPNHISRDVIGNMTEIMLISSTQDWVCRANIGTSGRSLPFGGCEKHLYEGWFEYLLSHQPNVGDVVEFTITVPPNGLSLLLKRNGQ